MRKTILALVVRTASLLLLGSTFPLQGDAPAQNGERPSEGRKAIRALGDSLRKKQTQARTVEELAEAFTLIDDAAQELHLHIGGQVQAMLSHRDAVVRRRALMCMANIGGWGPQGSSFAISTMRCLDDPDEAVRIAAMATLHQLLPQKSAIPKLMEFAKDKNPVVRGRAVGCLGYYARYFPDALAPVIEALGDDTEINKYNTIRAVALNALRNCGSDAKNAVPRIVKLIEKEENRHDAIKRALITLGNIAPTEPILLATTKEWLRSTTPEHRSDAAEVIWWIGEPGKGAVPELIAALKMTDVKDAKLDLRIKQGVVGTLGKIGPSAKEALPTLEALANFGDSFFREQVEKAIKAIRAGK